MISYNSCNLLDRDKWYYYSIGYSFLYIWYQIYVTIWYIISCMISYDMDTMPGVILSLTSGLPEQRQERHVLPLSLACAWNLARLAHPASTSALSLTCWSAPPLIQWFISGNSHSTIPYSFKDDWRLGRASADNIVSSISLVITQLVNDQVVTYTAWQGLG